MCCACFPAPVQNLARAHLYLWVADAAKVVVPNKTEEFFREFSDYITVREFRYDEAIRGTPWEGDKFFGNGTLVQSMMPEAGSYTDLVRILVLNNHGGEHTPVAAPSTEEHQARSYALRGRPLNP